MQSLCLLLLIAVCIASVAAQWGMSPYGGMGMGGPVGPFGGRPYARLRAMQMYGGNPYGGFGGPMGGMGMMRPPFFG
ncbi:unnamed protein product [Cylicocyclus nassatus]|uniref:Uncharacterized protein n=1 Tax=Cylicocyclus nassatus TaxID=53992 RepID=A0AA36H325_CYLNA|nr:unnamed protein product [Cylicocyclus nassatus]